MQAWPGAPVPRLPGPGLPVRVHDTASGAVRQTSPGATARLYVCGITPYDATHLGHAATYLAFDLLHRAWRDAGHDVSYTQNVTDVDDPLLARALERGEDWRAVAERETELFRADMAALRVLPPRDYVGAVEAIPLITDLVEQLRRRGAVYEVEGDLYFSVGSDPRFGEVSGLPAGQMRALFAERGGDPERPGKKEPLDCLLWQAERPGEPAWASPLGRGRPGWHVECAAIALAHLGPAFDVQGGGSDLAFPHHEMCASQARVVTGRPLAQAYVHAGMIGLDGEKMSKSRGNLVLVSTLRAEGREPAALRLALLARHYRTDREWGPEDLPAATGRLARWRAAVSAARPGAPPADRLLAEVRERLADDLDSPGALAAVDRWVAAAHAASGTGGQDTAGDAAAPALVADLVDALLGIDLRMR